MEIGEKYLKYRPLDKISLIKRNAGLLGAEVSENSKPYSYLTHLMGIKKNLKSAVLLIKPSRWQENTTFQTVLDSYAYHHSLHQI